MGSFFAHFVGGGEAPDYSILERADPLELAVEDVWDSEALWAFVCRGLSEGFRPANVDPERFLRGAMSALLDAYLLYFAGGSSSYQLWLKELRSSLDKIDQVLFFREDVEKLAYELSQTALNFVEEDESEALGWCISEARWGDQFLSPEELCQLLFED